MYKKIVEKVDEETQSSVTQIIGTIMSTWNTTNTNGREYMIHNLKDIMNQLEPELKDQMIGTCNHNRLEECSGCGDCCTY